MIASTLRALDFAIGKASCCAPARHPQAGSDLEHRGRAEAHGRPVQCALAQRTAMMARALEFFETYDLLLCPATIVPPYPIEKRYVAECDGHKFANYVEWLASSMRSRWPLSGAVAAVRLHREACRWDCRSSGRRMERRSCLRAPRCLRISWGCVGERRSIRGRRKRKFTSSCPALCRSIHAFLFGC